MPQKLKTMHLINMDRPTVANRSPMQKHFEVVLARALMLSLGVSRTSEALIVAY